MADFTDKTVNTQPYTLQVKPEDASGNPGTISGPLVWKLLNSEAGAVTPSTDPLALQGVYAPAKGYSGVAKITAADPADPAIPAVEADITVTLPLATRLVLSKAS